MELSDLPGELVERGIWWQIGGFAAVSAVSVALLVEFEGSGTRAYRYFEAAVRVMYWANVFVLFGLFEGVRKVFEKTSDIRRKYAERRAQERERAEREADRKAEARGEARGEARQRARRREAMSRFGIEVNGVRMLPDTPEVREFLGDPDQ